MAARQLGSEAAEEMAARQLGGFEAKSLGFTLAEVLITIAIIGVVAALTIPVIMTKYQEKKIEAAVDVFKTKILDTAGVMYAKGELDGTTSANFINKLAGYMKLTKTCTSNNLSDCFPSTIMNGDKEISLDNLKTPSSLGQSYTNDNNVGGVMADGTKFILSFDPNCSISNYSTAVASCMHMVVDLPISSNNNTVDEDIYLYNASLKNGHTVEEIISIGACNPHRVTGGNMNLGINADCIQALDNMSLKPSGVSAGRYIGCSCEGGCYDESTFSWNTTNIVTSCYAGSGTPEIE